MSKILLVKIGANLQDFNRQMNRATREIQTVSKTIGNIGRGLTTSVTLPIVGISTAALKVGVDFEKAMSEVAAISGATGGDLKLLEDKAKEMGKATSKSATESAQALSYMALAGWDAKTSAEALEPVLRLAEAGNLDLARTSDLVTDSMSSLGVSVEELPKYLDQVAQTARSSNTDIDALMEAFVVAGGTFKNLNVPLDEANAMLGVLANRGKKGSEAGNALNSIMVNLTTGAGQAGKAMSDLGISAFDSEGKFKGMSVVLKEVNDKTADMTEEQRNSYLAMIGGKTQLDTLQALLSGVGEEYDELKGKIGDSTGALNDMASTMQDNLQGQITTLKSALEGVGIQLAETLIPIISKVVDKISTWVEWFANLDSSTQEMIVKVGLVVAAIGPLLLIISKAIALYGQLKAAALILGPVLAGISAPVLIAVGAVTGLIAIGVALYKNWDVIKEKAEQMKKSVLGIWNDIHSGIKGTINKIIDSMNGMIGGLNKIKFDVPSWVPGIGGKGWGFNIPSIPRLARGGIVSSPTVAMVGEAGPEMVVPLENTSFVDKLASALGSAVMGAMQVSNSSSSGSGNREIVLQLDGTKLGRAILPKINQESERLGYKSILQV